MTENEKIELFDKWYDENYDEWAEGEEGIALREELEQAFKSGIATLEKENAELKCECRTCVYTDSPCVRSDYPSKDGVCSHYKNVFDENVELKQENKVLAQNLEDTEILNKTYEKRFNDLEKENAELKHTIAELRRDKDNLNTHTKAQKKLSEYRSEQLTKAKEIIKTFLGFAEAFGYSPSMDKFISDTEQFISEVEK